MKKTRRILRELRRKIRRRRRQRKEQREKFRRTHRGGNLKEAKHDSNRILHLKRLLGRFLRRKKRIEESHREGVDWAFGKISPEALKKAGKTFVCRYLSPDVSKNLSHEEVVRYSRAGIDIVVVWENSGERARLGYAAGLHDGNKALAQARILGKPPLAPIFFAVDFDAAGPEVVRYFEGVASAVGKKRSGVYGGLDVVEYLLDRHIVNWAWQTYAWSNHTWDKRAHLKQVLISYPGNELRVDGVQVDYDKSTKVNFGQWKSLLA